MVAAAGHAAARVEELGNNLVGSHVKNLRPLRQKRTGRSGSVDECQITVLRLWMTKNYRWAIRIRYGRPISRTSGTNQPRARATSKEMRRARPFPTPDHGPLTSSTATAAVGNLVSSRAHIGDACSRSAR